MFFPRVKKGHPNSLIHSIIYPILFISSVLIILSGCAQIKPMTLPAYNPPDLSSIKRPPLPTPIEGKDYTIDAEKNTVTYTISGQDLLAAEALSEQAGWIQVEMLKQIIGIQGEIIKGDRELIIVIDLKRQYAERQKIYGDVEKYVSWVISLIMMGLFIAK